MACRSKTGSPTEDRSDGVEGETLLDDNMGEVGTLGWEGGVCKRKNMAAGNELMVSTIICVCAVDVSRSIRNSVSKSRI